jgi:outer membrane protein insertion porin family
MKIFFWLFISLLSVSVYGLDITLNTQLDKKLETIKKSSKKRNSFKFNILRSVEIRGVNSVLEQSVRNELSVFKGDELDPFTINRNLKRVESMGYFDSVDSELLDFEGGKKWVISVKENPIVENIIVTGNESLPLDDILIALKTKKGKIFNYSTIREDVQIIEGLYKDQGFLFTKIKKVDLPSYKTKTLTFEIQETSYGDISVSGNTKTKDDVILREIEFDKEKKVNEKEIRNNLARIYNLNFFSEVVPDIVPSESTKNAYNIIINVKEKSTDSINFGGGWGQRSGGFLYSDLNINNLLGTGQLLALRGQWGSNLQTYQFKYHNPWMFGKRKSFTYRAWNTRGSFGFNNLTTSGFRPETRYGMDVAVGLPHSYELRSTHKVKTEDVYIDASSTSVAGNYSIQSYTYSLGYDTRDVMFNPMNGAYYTLSIENGFKFKNNSLIFTKYDASLSNFYQTFENQTIATRIAIGKINGTIQSTEYYYIGGPNTVRGYVEYPNSFAYGKNQLLGNIEYRFLLSDIFQFLFFIDAGWASSLGNDITQGKIGKGVGFRINSPLGPIRIDFGIDELGEMRTHFNIGHVF